jgi:hypothetical protein
VDTARLKHLLDRLIFRRSVENQSENTQTTPQKA